jgi:hypothetical protein
MIHKNFKIVFFSLCMIISLYCTLSLAFARYDNHGFLDEIRGEFIVAQKRVNGFDITFTQNMWNGDGHNMKLHIYKDSKVVYEEVIDGESARSWNPQIYIKKILGWNRYSQKQEYIWDVYLRDEDTHWYVSLSQSCLEDATKPCASLYRQQGLPTHKNTEKH